ncbi:MAG: UDP-N-acetylmuramoyl-L-alanyl-D-glutamate--2,6-diaminopimelate ligase [Rikenellaceae bacterium]|nr:UDP-N-acetylmuramoyl-L-alanyl-D-glutamate--2,6-diaminopimelate ligase [Rikenellaceae bacterium]
MKKLSALVGQVKILERAGAAEASIEALAYDSRAVEPATCFFAVEGTRCDGHDFIPMALERGASAILCRRLPLEINSEVAYLVVEDVEEAMAQMASAFYGDPSRELKLVGVTGTNGKTTIATLLYDLVRRMGYRAGLISTVVYKVDEREIPSTHTTPDVIRLNRMMREMVDAGCDYCFMECSSHAIVQKRIFGLHFTGAMFTNLTHDHLDYHKTFAEYLKAKKGLFDALPKGAFALVNSDDRNGAVMVQNTRARVVTASLRSMADVRCKIVELHLDGMLLQLDGRELWVHLTGRFNASNVMLVYGAAMQLGLKQEEILTALSALMPVSGRFECLHSAGGKIAVVDYAHTPDALDNVLSTIEELMQGRGRLLVVCGCGGDRDREKRPEMARIAARYASTVILTSDNPRHEDPEAILDEMMAGLKPTDRATRITDRAAAIRTAVLMAERGDVILVAGKGHENYQIVGDEKHHFDDREELRKAFGD